MACDEGQEAHLSGLSERFDQYVAHLKSSFGEIGDLRLTVMAGIMVMDELAETQKRAKGLENEIETLRRSHDKALELAESNDATVTGVLTDVATRLEQVASRIAPRAGS